MAGGAAPNHIMAMRRAIPFFIFLFLLMMKNRETMLMIAASHRHLPMKLQKPNSPQQRGYDGYTPPAYPSKSEAAFLNLLLMMAAPYD